MLAVDNARTHPIPSYDMMIVGGGINGTGLARDAAGRGLSVLLVEKEDLASHTSSASTKLIHGGLRYLEYGEFRLVREALMERERLLAIAPHLIRPLDFVLPQVNSPRPAWLVRLGLFLYDHLGGRNKLPATRTIRLDRDPLGQELQPGATTAFIYSDCWVDDSRLVVLNALDAAERGATILTRTALIAAERAPGGWIATIGDCRGTRHVFAKALINAAGPWVSDVLGRVAGARRGRQVRLIKGSHIVVPRLYEGAHAFLLQNPDRRVVFAIPYQDRFTLVGTTDESWTAEPGHPSISEAESRYLCETIGRYFKRPIALDSIVWSFSGIRALHDDESTSAAAITRDYRLDLDASTTDAPLLSVFGGKITTYRRLAEHALEKLAAFFPGLAVPWTATQPLPGGDIESGDFDAFVAQLARARPALPLALLQRLARAYGTRVHTLLGHATRMEDLGPDYGGGLHQIEVDYLRNTEWARTAEDILFRRSKLGIHLPQATAAQLDSYLSAPKAA